MKPIYKSRTSLIQGAVIAVLTSIVVLVRTIYPDVATLIPEGTEGAVMGSILMFLAPFLSRFSAFALDPSKVKRSEDPDDMEDPANA